MDPITGNLIPEFVPTSAPFNVPVVCPLKLSSLDLTVQLLMNKGFKIDKTYDENFDVYIFTSANKKILFRQKDQSWYFVGQDGFLNQIIVTDQIYSGRIKSIIDEEIFSTQLKTAGKTIVIVGSIVLAPYAATALGGGYLAAYAAGIGVDIISEGAIYLMEGDSKALITGLIISGISGGVLEGIPLIRNAMKKQPYDNFIKAEYKAARDALEKEAATTIKGKTDLAFRLAQDGNVTWAKWSDISAYAKQNGFTDADLSQFADDFGEYVKSGRWGEVLQCAVGNLRSSSRGGNCNYGVLKSWKLLSKHPQISADVSTLMSFNNLRLAGMPDEDAVKILDNLSDQLFIKCKTCKSGDLLNKEMHEVLDDIADAYTKYNSVSNSNFSRLITDLKNGYGFAEGAIFTLDAIHRNAADFPVGSTRFEINEIGGRIDVKVLDNLYEMKNVKSLPPEDFGKQFTRDLINATSLTNIKWWFNKRKLVHLPSKTRQI